MAERQGAVTELEFWQAMRASLLKQAHDLQEQRAAVLQQVAAIEQKLGMARKTSPTASARREAGGQFADDKLGT